MFEPTTLLYALVGAAGLLGADAYYNSSTIHIETSVAPIYEQKGFSQKVVEAIFAGELENIANTGSVTGQLQFLTSSSKPVSSAVAAAVHLEEPFEAAKSAVGINYAKVLASVVVDTKEGKDVPRIVVAGNTSNTHHFSFTVPLTPDTPVDSALAEAAFRTMNEINPYISALYSYQRAEKNSVHPTEADRLILEWLEKAPTSVQSPERGLFENLRGLSHLLDNDLILAETWFLKAHKSDPESVPAILNLAFIALYRGYFERAVELLEPVSESPFWSLSKDDQLIYSANVLLGVALAGQGKFEESEAHFAQATTLKTNAVSGYFYWARSLLKQNRTAEATSILETALRNATQIKNYPELANLYFWLPEEPNGILERRTNQLPKVLGMLVSPQGMPQ